LLCIQVQRFHDPSKTTTILAVDGRPWHDMPLPSDPRHSSGLNKYNVKAVRNELDNYVRYRAWNKFRARLPSLQSKPELFDAVILAKSKSTGGTLLHALLQLPESPMDLITSISTATPIAMMTQDARLQTPLHVAIGQNHSAKLIQNLLDLDTSENKMSLTIVDKQGDTPLLKAARLDAGYLNLILRYTIHHPCSILAKSKRKQRVALWYVASNELQVTNAASADLPKDLTLILLATYFGFQAKQGQLVEEREWIFLLESLNNASVAALSPATECHFDIALLMRAVVASAHLLRKFSVKILEFFIQRRFYSDFIASQEIDDKGNFILHRICMMDTTTSEDAMAFAPTNAILFDQVLRLDMTRRAAIRHSNHEGNLPLHLALVSNKGYLTKILTTYPEALQHINRQGELPLHIVLKLKSPHASWQLAAEIWNARPVVVEIQDGQTRLYPFQLAACGEWGSFHNAGKSWGKSDNDLELETEWLTFIYRLLSSAPQVLQSFKDVQHN
jgi:ankyrin repeat protein